jgi:hypothetical protein
MAYASLIGAHVDLPTAQQVLKNLIDTQGKESHHRTDSKTRRRSLRRSRPGFEVTQKASELPPDVNRALTALTVNTAAQSGAENSWSYSQTTLACVVPLSVA